MGEGDGTVSLLSLGAMCVEGWKRKRWNPSGMKVVTVEVCYSYVPDVLSIVVACERRVNTILTQYSCQIPHQPVLTIPRGGGTTADHVDILGNTALNEIILKVATGVSDEIEDSYVSNIQEYAKRVHWD